MYYERARKRPVITICGSNKFKEEILGEMERLTLEGNLVFSFGGFSQALTEEEKKMLEETHKDKILLSDSVFVVNVDGYIGESTKEEIAFAERYGKKITYMVP